MNRVKLGQFTIKTNSSGFDAKVYGQGIDWLIRATNGHTQLQYIRFYEHSEAWKFTINLSDIDFSELYFNIGDEDYWMCV